MLHKQALGDIPNAHAWDSIARSEWPEAPHDLIGALSFSLQNEIVRPWYAPSAVSHNICLRRAPTNIQQDNSWINLAEISVSDTASANAEALSALNSGATGILFCGAIEPAMVNQLLSNIQTRHCWIGFSLEKFSEDFLVVLTERLRWESGESAEFHGALFSASTEDLLDNKNLISFHDHFPNIRTIGLRITDFNSVSQALMVAKSGLGNGIGYSALAFQLPVGHDFFNVIITIRAFRMALACIQEIPDQVPYIIGHIETTSQPGIEPGGDLVASATAALAGVLGGLDALCVKTATASDYHFRKISLILSEEAQLGKVRDPLCGCWFIEEVSFIRAVRFLNEIGITDAPTALRASIRRISDNEVSVKEVWKSREGININSAYSDAQGSGFSADSAVPGVFPFLRGPYATMYTRRPWTIRQYAGFSTAEESNRFYRNNLAAGQTGLSIAFDLPTHRGYDSDHARVTGDVGKAGVAIDSVEDMKRLLDGIPLDKMSVSMTMNGAVLPIMAFYVVTAEEQGIPPSQLTGTIQNDILKEFMVRNTYIYPPDPSMRIVTDVMEYCARQLPRFNSISVSGYHMHEAGAPADLELAYTIADGLEYLRAAVDRGLKADAVAPRISFFWGIGMNFFMEIAKMRAARLLWAEQVKTFDPVDPRSCMLRVHCQTSGWSLSAQDPLNNVTRTAIEAVAAALGGTQSLHTNAMDEALALPSEYAAAVARNTQIFLQRSSGICKVVDPFGGSNYLESLTAALIDKTRIALKEIKRAGGMTEFVKAGIPKINIAQAAAQRQARIDSGEEIIVGVNLYGTGLPGQLPVREIDQEKVRLGQEERLREVRIRRDESLVQKALEDLEAGARSDINLLGLCVAAARSRCTLGEISLTLERVFGRYISHTMPTAGVYSSSMKDPERLKAVQKKSDTFAAMHGRRPRLLVAKIGQDGHDRGAQVVASAFADFGFDVDIGPLFATPAEVARQAVENDVHVVGISTLAGGHNRLIPDLIRELLQQGAGREVLVVAGGVIPESDRAGLTEAGVHMIFGPGTNMPEAASEILDKLLTMKHRMRF